MVVSLISLWIKSLFRKTNFYQSLILLFCIEYLWCIQIFNFREPLYKTIQNMLTLTQSTTYTLIINILLLFLLSDLFLKLIFKKNTTVLPLFVQTVPLSRKVWNTFSIWSDIMSLWNTYYIFVLTPLLVVIMKSHEIMIVLGLSLLISLINSKLAQLSNSLFRVYPQKLLYLFTIYAGMTGGLYLLRAPSTGEELYTIWGATLLLGAIATVFYLISFRQAKLYYNDTAQSGQHSFLPGIASSSLFKMEFIYLLRSKRFRYILIPIVIFLLLIYQDDNNIFPIKLFAAYFLVAPSISIGQFTLGIEANFFCGIWTKPFSMKNLLNNKYQFYILLTFITSLFLAPLVWEERLSLPFLIASALYMACFANLLVLPVIFFARRLDLQASSFANHQGTSFVSSIYVVLIMLVSMGIHYRITSECSEWNTVIILSLIGIASFLLRKQFISMICHLFDEKKYEIMERFRQF